VLSGEATNTKFIVFGLKNNKTRNILQGDDKFVKGEITLSRYNYSISDQP
jgi:hypothetical protein